MQGIFQKLAHDYGAGMLFPAQGAEVYLPAATGLETTGDPRRSCNERYANNAAYVAAIKQAGGAHVC